VHRSFKLTTERSTMTTQTRTVSRGHNPFAAIARQQNAALTPTTKNTYESLTVRGQRVFSHPVIQDAIADLKSRLGNRAQYRSQDFGEVLCVPFSLVDINIDIQRDEDIKHIADDILARFDPRICMPVMCTRLANGRYSAWEGQQTSLTLYVLHLAGLLSPDTQIQVKAYDESLAVPGTTLQGEAVGNLGFRIINGGGRKAIDAYTLHRSRVNGVRIYNSQFREDLQSEEIQQILEHNHMFPAKMAAAARNQATPGMVTYIHGCNLIAGHDTETKNFNLSKKDLDWTLRWHDYYYSNEKGVDGGFILAFGRLAAAARAQNIVLDQEVEKDLHELFRSKYGSPKGFHRDCKDRLKKFQTRNNLADSWSDNCLAPILVLDYYNWGGKLILPQVSGQTTYAGI